jgi:long-chain acyl-CoA synthetase
VVGENKPFIGAVVVLQAQAWQRLAAELGLDPASPASLADERARRAALQRITALTASFPRYAQPRAVLLTLDPWTVENTLMTPTLKLKRLNLMAHFARELAAMYAPR